ncbi:carboxylesterase family protein [Shewanella donghaensis]|uniref:carboxylesterase family protein n=1 Tax=Shewanella donghaensis TaxID=238836 RepID=UPI001183181A|nr:carboxylesterase family protein [Shewanella donghaensis]
MKVFYRSTLAVLISLTLVACGGSDDSAEKPNPEPEIPAPVEPLPVENINVEIGNNVIQALKESVVVSDLAGADTRVELEAFKGIEYANALRFEHSITTPLSQLSDATEFGDACPQTSVTTQQQSEACLNLNIWRPENTQASANLPVYVFVHGGDFEEGAGSDPLIHGDNVVAQGSLDGEPFIAITLNYRLGVLGSNWVDGTKSPEGGNYGLGDQKRALEWVNNNIDLFGGNPNDVIVVGQGAGAMNVGIMQQSNTEENVAGDYFQRAIMQSNPYGFDYKSYAQAESFSDRLQQYSEELFGETAPDSLADLSLDQIMQVQAKATNPIQKIAAWSGINCIDIDNLVGSGLCLTSKISDETTPLANLMPFSPYVEYRAKKLFTPEVPGYHFIEQPAQNELTVPTVFGFNSQDASTTAFLPSLTSLIPTIIQLIQEMNDVPAGQDPAITAAEIQDWLASQDNLVLLEQKLQQLSADDVQAQVELGDILPSTAYEAITHFYFGLGNGELISNVFNLTDYNPKAEDTLSGATGNMGQFKQLVNDMLFSGPAHVKAKQTADDGLSAITLYQFDYKPSFNVWTVYNEGENIDLGELVKSVACIGNICSGAELPFVFNKSLNLAGSAINPSDQDIELMNKMSRLWFSNALFEDYQFDSNSDSVLVIDADADIKSISSWDKAMNQGVDPDLKEGRLSGLAELGLIFSYFND